MAVRDEVAGAVDDAMRLLAPWVRDADPNIRRFASELTRPRGVWCAQIETLKAELSEEIDRTVHTMQDEATVFADPNDRASQESDMALELRNRDRERKLIKKIDETIARIDANEYGYCDSCGVEIGLKRLEARPTATLCIDCKTLDELRERQVAK